MRIVFMGTPAFAVPCLQRLLDLGHTVTGVFTQPDKPQGRHGILTPPPVKTLALAHGLPVYQPDKMRDGTALELLQAAAPELVIVVAYGKILPQALLDVPPCGCINIHASLLPQLRGAAPIQWSILNGFDETGVTAMQMDAGLDTGDMLLSRTLAIDPDETAGALSERLSQLGADVLEETLAALQAGTLTRTPQPAEFTYAPMLSKALSPVDWRRTARQIHDQIRGLSPWPGATAQLSGKTVKLHQSRLLDQTADGALGTVLAADKRLIVVCGDGGCLEITELQAQGKRAMSAADFLRGNPVTVGDRFGGESL
ncbi:MAG: methionyl-tRNA formyltransferase [Clostridia bacterium]|nr:methionyl-tRNA formyltransferase [Clostridia bacterium]